MGSEEEVHVDGVGHEVSLLTVGHSQGAPPALVLSVRDAARALAISPRTLAALTAAGEVPSFKLRARRLYSADALAEWVAARATQAQAVRR